MEKADHEWCESVVSHAVVDIDLQCQLKPSFLSKRRKLLQFDKSYRPAYYGSFSKRSEFRSCKVGSLILLALTM